MNLSATIVNSLWSATNLPSYLSFRRALAHPRIVQDKLLRTHLERNRNTAFGLKHDFRSVHNYEEFSQRLPLTDYVVLEPWIDRVRHGESNVLTADAVTRLVPTSGSTGSRKLIPFTARLQREFSAALGPWLVDLFRRSPGLAGGPAYWSITPVGCDTENEDSAVPIGFDRDTAYLGGTRQWLANAVMAVPEELRFVEDFDVLRYITLFCLLRHRELRLISVWHPSFLLLLLNALPANWQSLLEDIRSGRCRHASALPPEHRAALKLPPLPRRERELRAVDPSKPEEIWPRLKLISCWGDGTAELAASNLKQLFPTTVVQPKGLLATEAFVTIPFAGVQPVAIRSHFF